MAGKIVADQLEHSTAGSIATNYVVNGSAKAWVNFNGTGTIAARDSLNTSGLVDNGTGSYTVNFTNSMSTANFTSPISSSAAVSTITSDLSYQSWKATTSCQLGHYENGSLTDQDSITLGINGELA